MRLLVTQSDRETILECRWPSGLRLPALLAITELLFWVALVRLATRVEVRPVRVLAPEPPEDVDAYRDYLGVAVQEGPRQCIAFAAVDASRPFLTANEPMWEFLETALRGRLAEMNESATTSDRVRGALLELLPAGQALIQEVSEVLGGLPANLAAETAGREGQFPFIVERDAQGSGVALPPEFPYACRRDLVPARIPGLQFVLPRLPRLDWCNPEAGSRCPAWRARDATRHREPMR